MSSEPSDDGAANASEDGLSMTSQAFVVLRQDTRKCVAPLCGGFWLRPINRTTAEEYVSGLDLSASGLSADEIAKLRAAPTTELVLKGKLGPLEKKSKTHTFVVTEAYRGSPAVSLVTGDVFYKAHDRSPPISCFAAPCNNEIAEKLNYTTTFDFTKLSVTRVTTSAADQAWLSTQVLSHGAIVAAHTTNGTKFGTKYEKILDTTQVFVRLPYSKPSAGGACALTGATTVSGRATFYTPGTTTSCGISESSLPVGALAGVKACGACVEVTGPSGAVVVRTVDSCPTCGANDIDLSEAAFEKIAPISAGTATVSWRMVECPTTAKTSVRLGAGSNPYYLTASVENNRTPVVGMEVRSSGSTTWQAMTASTWSASTFVISPTTPLVAPIDVRLTDTNGATSTATVTSIVGDAEASFVQFPSACAPPACPLPGATTISGNATFYTPSTSTTCGISASDLPVVALPGAKDCGTCIEVTGPSGKVVARTVDTCPSCGANDVDLSQDAFEQISPISAGKVAVTWKKVECPGTASPSVRVGVDSNPYYVTLSVENNRTPVVGIDVRSSGSTTWQAMTVSTWSASTFVINPTTALVAPIDVRLTDIGGAVSTGTVTSIAGNVEASLAQFPSTCH